MLKVPDIIDRASSSSPRYLSQSPSSVDMIGSLWARDNLILHSLWITFSTSSRMEYSLVSPPITCWTFSTLGLWGSLTVRLMRCHICLLSSRLIVCLMSLTRFYCFLVCASMRQSRRCTFLRPLPCFRSSAFWIRPYLTPSFSSSGQFVGGLNVRTYGEADYIANVLGFSLLQLDQLEICMYSVVPHLDCWAIAVGLQNVLALLLCMNPYCCHLPVELDDHGT